MDRHPLFLSYKRGPITTPVVERLYRRIKVQLASRGVEPFFDRKSIEAGEPWEPAIDGFIARATLFVAFISIDFWLSEQCRRELDLAIKRYETEGRPRLLFVLADPLDPNDLAFGDAAVRKSPDAAARMRKVESIGWFNFLGPYAPGSGALVRLEFETPAKADLQLAQLVESIKGLEEVKSGAATR